MADNPTLRKVHGMPDVRGTVLAPSGPMSADRTTAWLGAGGWAALPSGASFRISRGAVWDGRVQIGEVHSIVSRRSWSGVALSSVFVQSALV